MRNHGWLGGMAGKQLSQSVCGQRCGACFVLVVPARMGALCRIRGWGSFNGRVTVLCVTEGVMYLSMVNDGTLMPSPGCLAHKWAEQCDATLCLGTWSVCSTCQASCSKSPVQSNSFRVLNLASTNTCLCAQRTLHTRLHPSTPSHGTCFQRMQPTDMQSCTLIAITTATKLLCMASHTVWLLHCTQKCWHS